MYEIYTDGAYSFKNNTGGIAVVVIDNEVPIIKYNKKYINTTNNRMELLAVITALRMIQEDVPITLYSDSMYVVGSINLGWKRKKNLDLWKIYDELKKPTNFTVKHVDGHAGNKWNEVCDSLAVRASQLLD